MDRSSRELPPALDAPRLEIEGAAGRLSYYADTSASGRPLLLLHSLNAAPSAFEMKPLFDAYRATRPVFALDLPGFGFSERGPRDYSVELYTTAIHEILGVIGGDSPDVVALSLTSEFAARTAVESRLSMATLSLMSPTGFGLSAPPAGKAGDRIERFLGLRGVGSSLFRLITSYPSLRYFLKQSFHGEPSEAMIEYAHATANRPGARHPVFAFLSFKLFSTTALESIYSKLEIPTLVLYDKDPHVSFEGLPVWSEARNDRRVERISPTLGLPHWEDLPGTKRALDSFWNEQSSSG